MLHAIVHPADIQDRDGGILLLATPFGMYPFLKKLSADGGYQGVTPDAWFDAFQTHGLEAHAIDELCGECRRVHQRDLAAIESVNILFCRPNSQAARCAGS